MVVFIFYKNFMVEYMVILFIKNKIISEKCEKNVGLDYFMSKWSGKSTRGGYIKKENKNQYHNRERGVYEKVSKNKHNVGGYVLNRF